MGFRGPLTGSWKDPHHRGFFFFRDAKILNFPNASALMFVLNSPPTLFNPFREWVRESSIQVCEACHSKAY
jgi:hypothetical protein